MPAKPRKVAHPGSLGSYHPALASNTPNSSLQPIPSLSVPTTIGQKLKRGGQTPGKPVAYSKQLRDVCAAPDITHNSPKAMCDDATVISSNLIPWTSPLTSTANSASAKQQASRSTKKFNPRRKALRHTREEPKDVSGFRGCVTYPTESNLVAGNNDMEEIPAPVTKPTLEPLTRKQARTAVVFDLETTSLQPTAQMTQMAARVYGVCLCVIIRSFCYHVNFLLFQHNMIF